MTPKSAIQKGKELEQWVVDRLRASGLDGRAMRNPGSGNGLAKGDIATDLNLALECKNQKSFRQEWFKQSRKQALGDQIPVIVYHAPQTPLDESKVIIDWTFFEELLLRHKEPVMKQPDREARFALENLKNAAHRVLKIL